MAQVRRNYAPRVIKLLFMKGGQHCNYPNCPNVLVADASDTDEHAVLAEIAHIEAASDDGPRPNPSLTPAQRNSYDNLILLCAHHHNLVDAQPSTYTADDLRTWKRSAEQRTKAALQDGIGRVAFPELEIACAAFANQTASAPSSPLLVVGIVAKLEHNGLGESSARMITLGLSQAEQVAAFLSAMSALDSDYGRRLRGGFLAEYLRLQNEGATGDELFASIWGFAARVVAPPDRYSLEATVLQAAALAVVAHLFEICDLFEPAP